REQHALALGAHQDLVLGQLKVIHEHGFAVVASCVQRRFIHHVGEFSAGEARSAARKNRKIHIVGQGNLACMYAKDLFTSTNVGKRDHHAAIEASGTEQRWIQYVRPVGGGDQDDAFIGLEAVHFHQELVQGLLALIVPAAQARSTVAAHGVNFID